MRQNNSNRTKNELKKQKIHDAYVSVCVPCVFQWFFQSSETNIKITSEKRVNTPIWKASALKSIKHNWTHIAARLNLIVIYVFILSLSLSLSVNTFWIEQKSMRTYGISNRKMCAAPNTHAHIYIKPMTHFHSHSHSAILNLTRLISKVLNHQRNRFHAFTTTLFVYACVRILSKTINCATVICNKIRGVVKIERKTERESEIILKIEINIWT